MNNSPYLVTKVWKFTSFYNSEMDLTQNFTPPNWHSMVGLYCINAPYTCTYVDLFIQISSQIPTGSVIELVRDGMVGALGGCEAQTGRGGGALIFVVFWSLTKSFKFLLWWISRVRFEIGISNLYDTDWLDGNWTKIFLCPRWRFLNFLTQSHSWIIDE